MGAERLVRAAERGYHGLIARPAPGIGIAGGAPLGPLRRV